LTGRARLTALDGVRDLALEYRPEGFGERYFVEPRTAPEDLLNVGFRIVPALHVQVRHQPVASLRMMGLADPHHRVGWFPVGEVRELERQLAPSHDVNDPASPRVDVVIGTEIFPHILR